MKPGSNPNLEKPGPVRVKSALLNIEKIIMDELRAFGSADTSYGRTGTSFGKADTSLESADTTEDSETKSLTGSDLDEGFFDRNSTTPDSVITADSSSGSSEYTFQYSQAGVHVPGQEI